MSTILNTSERNQRKVGAPQLWRYIPLTVNKQVDKNIWLQSISNKKDNDQCAQQVKGRQYGRRVRWPREEVSEWIPTEVDFKEWGFRYGCIRLTTMQINDRKWSVWMPVRTSSCSYDYHHRQLSAAQTKIYWTRSLVFYVTPTISDSQFLLSTPRLESKLKWALAIGSGKTLHGKCTEKFRPKKVAPKPQQLQGKPQLFIDLHALFKTTLPLNITAAWKTRNISKFSSTMNRCENPMCYQCKRCE